MEYKTQDFLNIANEQRLLKRGFSVKCYPVIDSTQSSARRYVTDGGGTPALFVADTQTEGRGRLGRSFYSPATTGIYMTLLLDVSDDTADGVSRITSAVAVAVARTLFDVLGVECKIKWVNDILVDGKKACGILAESFFSGDKRYVSIGIGINLATKNFPSELEHIATSLSENTDKRAELTVLLAVSTFDIYSELKRGNCSYMEQYRELSAVLGKRVTFTENGTSKDGTAVLVDDFGRLCIRLDSRETVMLSGGEISLRIKNE